MIVFHVPSWYPYPKSPYSGVFIKELIEAYAAINTDDICIISNFHQLQFDMSFREPIQFLKNTLHYQSLSSVHEIRHSSNLLEYQSKILVGNLRLFGLRIKKQLAISVQHFELLLKRNMRPDIIHAHVCYPAGVIARQLGEKFKVPYVISEQSGTVLLQDAFEKYLLKDQMMDAYHHARKISALSTFHIKELEKLNLNNISLIPNLVNESLFKVAEKPANPVFSFFTLAWINESKGIRDLLLAVNKLIKQNYKIRVKIGGTGNQADEYKKLSKDLGIDSFLEWAGPLNRTQVAACYQQCDCFILPSKSESLGVVYIEAIASGKPVIATNCGGPADIINENNGLLVEVGNIDAIANAMIRMIERSKEYNSETIRNDFMQRFSRKAIVKRVRTFYDEAITAG